MSRKIPVAWCRAGVIASLFCSAIASAEENIDLHVEAVVLRPLHEAEVPAQQTGLLRQIDVLEGQQVEQGQLLASLDAREVQLAVARAKIEHAQAAAKTNNQIRIRYAEKALEVAEAELERSNESIAQFAKSVSQSQMDVEQLTVEKLKLEREQAEHELELARFDLQLTHNQLEAAKLRLEQHRIIAPFAGTVVLVRGRLGEWVEVGAPVLRLVATDRLRAEGFLPAQEASTDLVGSEVTLQVASGSDDIRVSGVLRFVSPELEPVTRQVRVWAEIPNNDYRLRPGQQGSMRITSQPADGQ